MSPFRAAAICAAVIGCATTAAQRAPADLVLEHVSVVDVENGRVTADRTVAIRGNRIVSVDASRAARPSAGATVIDATGKFLIPGLWDMHVHSAAAASREFPTYVALGVTGVRNMHTSVDTALALVGALKRQLASGQLVGPRLLANGPVVDGPRPAQPGSVALANAEAGRRAVDSLAAGGADFIKVYLRLPRETYLAVADQAKRRGIPLVGHLPIAVRLDEALAAGQRTVEHADVLDWECSTRGDSIRSAFLADPAANRGTYMRARAALTSTWSLAQCAPAIAALKRHGTWSVPTLVVGWAPLNGDIVLADTVAAQMMPSATIEQWRTGAAELPPQARAYEEAQLKTSFELVGALHRAGVPLLAGSDVGNPFLVPGYSLHTELELLVRAGLTPLEALRTATLNPARFLGATDSLGTVAPGRIADLALLDANPLDDIRNTRRVRAVVLNGRHLDRSALDAMLARVKPGAR